MWFIYTVIFVGVVYLLIEYKCTQWCRTWVQLDSLSEGVLEYMLDRINTSKSRRIQFCWMLPVGLGINPKGQWYVADGHRMELQPVMWFTYLDTLYLKCEIGINPRLAPCLSMTPDLEMGDFRFGLNRPKVVLQDDGVAVCYLPVMDVKNLGINQNRLPDIVPGTWLTAKTMEYV